MRMSKLFFQTLREVPAEAEIASHRLMLRAALVHPIAAGIFDYLPLGQRVKHKIEAIMRDEMDAIGGQEVTLPMVHPAELWQQTGRWYEIGDDMARLKDRNGRDYCLGMTHEEIMAELAQAVVSSYRQLPFVLYQIQTKFRDEPRPRGGMIRVREFTMKDAYSFDRDMAGLDAFYPQIYQAYFNIFRRCGLDVVAVESDTGMMGGTMAHEFMALTPVGEDTLLLCDACGYKANRQIAVFEKSVPAHAELLAREEVHTPGINTIDALAEFLNISAAQTAKALFLVAELDSENILNQASEQAATNNKASEQATTNKKASEQATTNKKASEQATTNKKASEQAPESSTVEKFVFAVVRGDMDLNETKLTNALRARRLRPATEAEIRAVGAEPGYGSPIDIDREQVILVVDDLVAMCANLVAGANRKDYHFRNVNFGRDYTADIVTDIVAASAGDACPNCGAALRSVRGVEVGNIFKLGTKYSAAMGATYLDEAGQQQPIVMGSYGIGTGRLIASVIEHRHDENGIQWPITIAPYQVVLVSLGTGRTPEVIEAADRIYAGLQSAGVEILYDDRDERAGVKFNDADLLGMPIRLTLGAKGLKNGIVEMKLRRSGEERELNLDTIVEEVQALIEAEMATNRQTLVEERLA